MRESSAGKFTRMSVEIDISKPLMAKFKLNNRIWEVQYEGIRMIRFQCGKVGHTKEKCEGSTMATSQETGQERMEAPELVESFGSWMLPDVVVHRPDYTHQEVMHSMRAETGPETMIIKIDLEKAYDRLKWSFLRDTLGETRIPFDLAEVMMECVTSTSMKILWNGVMGESFTSSRGVRQGDLLSSWILSFNLSKNVPQNLLLLQSYGLSSAQIKQLTILKPLTMVQKSQWFEKNLKTVEEKLGIPRTSPMFVHGITACNKINEAKFESRLRVFRSYGWSETDISTLLRKHPSVLNLTEKSVMVKLKYFMEKLGYGSDFLASRPALLSYSMEKRIVPRTAVIRALKEKNLLETDIGFYTLIARGESYFLKNFVVNFKDKMPQLYEDYMKQKSSSSSGVSL